MAEQSEGESSSGDSVSLKVVSKCMKDAGGDSGSERCSLLYKGWIGV